MKRALAFFVALLAVAGAIVGVVLVKSQPHPLRLPGREVDTFLHAWARNDAADMATLIDRPPANLATAASNLLVAVPGSTATYTRTALTGTASDATATYHAEVVLKGLGTIQWDGSLALAHSKAGWLITWDPADLYPGLTAGQYLTVKRAWPERASILAADGSVLAGNETVVTVGLEASHIKTPADLAAVKFALKSLLGVDPATIDSILSANKAHPDYFLPLVPVRKDASYQHIHDTLYPIPGIIFQTGKGVVALDAALTSEILGTVGDITAQRLTELGSPYATGDKVGLSGLEAAYEKRLAGHRAPTS